MAEKSGSAGLPLEEPGLWVERTGDRDWPAGKPAVFLDRDGTISVDTGYPCDPEEVELRDEIVPVIRAANLAGIPVVVVTNQSGIARGYFGWAAFAAVNRRVLDLLGDRDCHVDLVIACAYHQAGRPPYAAADHPMRKPGPGMFLRAAELLKLDLARSIVIGDKPEDMEAGQLSGLAAGWMMDGSVAKAPGFPVGSMRDAGHVSRLLARIAAMAASGPD
jgi:D-glycero-D-manno-heptose 1,7-bisphosphate phosphatase